MRLGTDVGDLKQLLRQQYFCAITFHIINELRILFHYRSPPEGGQRRFLVKIPDIRRAGRGTGLRRAVKTLHRPANSATDDGQANQFAHAADLAFAAFFQDKAELVFVLPGHLRRAQFFAVEFEAVVEQFQALIGKRAFYAHHKSIRSESKPVPHPRYRES